MGHLLSLAELTPTQAAPAQRPEAADPDGRVLLNNGAKGWVGPFGGADPDVAQVAFVGAAGITAAVAIIFKSITSLVRQPVRICPHRSAKVGT